VFNAWDITITANTLDKSPKEQTLKLTKGVIVKCDVKFPAGCHGLVKVRLFYHTFQLIPLTKGEYITGDDETVPTETYFELAASPYALTFEGSSPDTTYNHTVTIRVTVVPKAIASIYPLVEWLNNFAKRIFGR